MKNIYCSSLVIILFFYILLVASLTQAHENNDVKLKDARGLNNTFYNYVDISAMLEEEWMIETEKGHTQKLQTSIHPELKIGFPLEIDFTSIGRFRFDAVDELEKGDPSQNEISPASRRLIVGDRIDLGLREFYIEKNIKMAYLKLGKQQIVWGNSDGLKVLDVVNPQDFREFIYDEWADSRIPLWSVNVEIPVKNLLLQLVWIPDRTYHKLPEAGSTFSFTSPMIIPKPPENTNVYIRSAKRPKRFLSDSDAGARLSGFWKGWDFTLNYLYHYDDVPVAFQDISISQGTPLVTVTPRYKRTHLVGGTFSNAFKSLVIRGEVGYFFNKYFLVDDLKNRDGVSQANELSYVLGFDWSGISDTLLSFQLFQGLITKNPSGLIRDQVETNASLYISREFLNNVLHTECIWLQNLNRNDGFFLPKIRYELKDNVILKCGFDFFYGSDRGIFGQFNKNDRVSLGIEISL